MGEWEGGGESMGVRRSGMLVGKRRNGPVVVVMDEEDGEGDEEVGEVGVEEEEEEEEWEPGAGRKSERKGGGRRSTKRGDKEKTSSSRMGFDAVLRGLGSVSLSEVDRENSRDAQVVVNALKPCVRGEVKSVKSVKSRPVDVVVGSAVRSPVESVPQGLTVADPSKEGTMEDMEMVDSYSECSDDEDEGDFVTDYESPDEQEVIDTSLSSEAEALFAEVTKVLREGGDLKKLKVDHLKAYLRRHGLRLSGVKAVLLSRCEDHLRLRYAHAETLYPRSSFSINCKGDVCLGDTVLFLHTVFDNFKRPVGKRWVAGRVVNESYGARKQQHTFTVEVFWSTGTQPCYLLQPLLIKGRNMYRFTTTRQPWSNEADRQKVLDEKHARGAEAREKRRAARESSSRGRSTAGPNRRGRSNTRGGVSRSVRPAIPPSQNSMQYDRNRSQQTNIHTEQQYRRTHSEQQYGRAHTEQHGRIHTEQHGRIQSEQQGRIQSEQLGRIQSEQQGRIQSEQLGRIHTEQQGRIHTEQQGRIHNEQLGRIHTEQQGRIHTEQHGRIHTEQHGRIQSEQLGRIHTEQQGRIHTEQQGRIHNEQLGRIHTEQQGRIHTEQHGRIHTEQHGRIQSEQLGRIHTEQQGRIHTEQQGRIHNEQLGRIHTEQQGRIHTEQHGRIHTEQHGRIHSEQHGRTYAESHAYRGSTGAQATMAHTKEIVHIGCSTRGCEKSGAKQCISQSCASCCYRNISTRGSCPRHQ
ncbi:hypothetical protein KC19_3G005100 [Ceratodon purpureus]|uniref:SAP domain-containing protein n=1 Tax=Ceratodon purpureus TaxID=3225 RepID=A0A8T0IDD0_CERPU|nr:hypothetical protein KC19_3G005100 [Ceratodon purpureus]